jgi:CubicO group peptidase (beta-lactamase class C family)
MLKRATDYIDKLTYEKKLPLLDVLVYKDHKEIYRRTASYTGKHTADELLTMFSCTKVLTAALGMRLIEEGKIELDAPVSNYIPKFSSAYTLDENNNRHPEVITVRHLFTMSSGFDYKLRCPEILRISEEKYDTASTVDVICALLDKPLNFTPGDHFLYSLSHDALGALIEAVTGLTLAEYAQKYVFDPLGMKSSTLFYQKYIKNPPTVYDIVENGYEPEKENTCRRFHPTKNYVSGGGGLISTVKDYAILADTLAAGGTGENGYRLLKPETIEKMKGVQFDCLNVKNNYTCVQGKDYAYGLGVRVRTVKDSSGIPVGEFGWDGAAGSYTLIDTDNAISITMGMNVMNWPEIFRGEHLAIARLIYEEII